MEGSRLLQFTEITGKCIVYNIERAIKSLVLKIQVICKKVFYKALFSKFFDLLSKPAHFVTSFSRGFLSSEELDSSSQ